MESANKLGYPHSWLYPTVYQVKIRNDYVFERIDSKQFEQCFERWVKQLIDELGISLIAVDGKSVNGSYDRESGTPALHLVSAWASEHRLVLAQAKVQDKSNEITAIPALLELLDLAGCIVTLDAMGTQKSIARQIHRASADYILSLKSNHPTLFQQVEQWFQQAQAEGTLPTPLEHTTETGHHRIDTRTVWTLPVDSFATLHQADEWAGLQSIVVVERTRRLWNKTTHEVQFYLSSLPPESPKIATAIRQHWGIENGLHWILDVTFGEDACPCAFAPCTPQFVFVTPLCRQCAQSSRRQTESQAEV